MFRETSFGTGYDPDSGLAVFAGAKKEFADIFGLKKDDLYADFTATEDIERLDMEKNEYLKKYRERFGKVFPLLDICDRSALILRGLRPELTYKEIAEILDNEKVYTITPQALCERLEGRKGKTLSLQTKVKLLEENLSDTEIMALESATEEYKSAYVSRLITRLKKNYL